MSRRNKTKLIVIAVISIVLTVSGVGASVYLATQPGSQSPVSSAGEPTPETRTAGIPTATPIPIPAELPTIFKTFDAKIIPTSTPTPVIEIPTSEETGSDGSGPTLSEDQKQEAAETLDKLPQMPPEFKEEFLEWLKEL